MTRRTLADTAIARRLVALEEQDGDAAVHPATAAVRVYEKLNGQLAPLIGEAGAAALFGRAARLLTQEFACFEGLFSEAAAPGAEGLLEALRALDYADVGEASVALFATVFALLTAFLGDELVGQILRCAFPACELTVTKETE